MKKSLRRIVCFMLVMAVLMTSMLVGSVGAATTLDPMQTVLLQALTLVNSQDKSDFKAALAKAVSGDVDGAVADIHTLIPSLSEADTKLALEQYIKLTDNQREDIGYVISRFELDVKSYDGNGFDTIIDKINNTMTGDASNDQGVSLLFQIITFINSINKDGIWATDLSSNTSKIAFDYNKNNLLVSLGISSFNNVIDSMQTLKNRISSATGSTMFDKLLNYTAAQINEVNTTEITALKKYLNDINDAYYVPYVDDDDDDHHSGGSSSSGTTPNTGSQTQDVSKAIDELKKIDTANTDKLSEAKKNAQAAVNSAIANAGTVKVTPSVSNNTAKITSDQIKESDILSKADAVIKKADELSKLVEGTGITVQKKVTIELATNNADKVDVSLKSDLLSKLEAKGIQAVEIVSGDVKLNIPTDYSKDTKGSKEVSFQINKVTVNDELKAKMSDEQKALLSSDAAVFDFNAFVTSSDGTKTKITEFDKPITVKIKYKLKAGEDKDKITVLYLADDGSVKNMVGRYNEVTGEVEFEARHFSTYVIKHVARTFKDVLSGAWYKSQAEALAAKGIVEGRSGNNFVPNANITRAEFMTMLVKAMNIYDENATCDFVDVDEDSWYYSYVATAYNAGIVSGVGNNMFAPNSLITREQMAVMLSNASGIKNVENSESYLKASDASKISSYARKGMAVCVKNGFIVGSSNKLDPQGKATRAMAAVVVYKYFNFVY